MQRLSSLMILLFLTVTPPSLLHPRPRRDAPRHQPGCGTSLDSRCLPSSSWLPPVLWLSLPAGGGRASHPRSKSSPGSTRSPCHSRTRSTDAALLRTLQTTGFHWCPNPPLRDDRHLALSKTGGSCRNSRGSSLLCTQVPLAARKEAILLHLCRLHQLHDMQGSHQYQRLQASRHYQRLRGISRCQPCPLCPLPLPLEDHPRTRRPRTKHCAASTARKAV